MPKLYIVRGIPGSGKSTIAREIVSKDPTHTVRFNWDDLRNMMGPYWIPERENTKILEDLKETFMRRMMLKGWNIVSDNMNLNLKEIDYYKDIVETFNSTHASDQHYTIEIIDCFTPVEECIRRDAMRPNPIGAATIKQIWNRYRPMICNIENRKVVEGWKEPQNNLEKAVIFDADATLGFNVIGRPYWGPGAAEGMLKDVPNRATVTAAQVYHDGKIKVILVTGREGTEEIQEATKKWMETNKVPIDEYHFREVGSRESGDTFKVRLINDLSSKYDIIGIYEDSSKIVKPLRDAGYTVFQPNEGKF